MFISRAQAARMIALCLIPATAIGVGLAVCTRNAAAAQESRTGAAQADPPANSLAARGKMIFDQTPKLAAPYVGNKLSCSDCHIDSGTKDYASSLKDVAGLFPSYSKRAGRVITLTERVNECFVRSENGHPLPAKSPEMLAMIAYMQFLAQGQKPGQPYAKRGLAKLPELAGDATRGKQIYNQSCAMCHGVNGGGMPPVMPPVWGPDSYNDGAGMSHTPKMAAWVYKNMPQTNPGSLTPQQSYDVSAYIDSMPRPQFNPVYKSF
ncbi:MAG: c-type cytochrome [Acidobacteriota bacterium]